MQRSQTGTDALATTELWLIRHAESIGNRDGWYQGQDDPPLTPRGHQEARRLAARLRGQLLSCEEALQKAPGVVLYCSDLVRAMETAQYVAHALDLPFYEDERLRELDLGRWEGLTSAEIAERYPEEWRVYCETFDPTFPRGGGESYAEAQQRIVPAIEEIARRHAGDTVLLLFHGGVMRTYLAHVLGLPLEHTWRLPLRNTAISRVRPFASSRYNEISPPGLVLAVNDAAHLEQL